MLPPPQAVERDRAVDRLAQELELPLPGDGLATRSAPRVAAPRRSDGCRDGGRRDLTFAPSLHPGGTEPVHLYGENLGDRRRQTPSASASSRPSPIFGSEMAKQAAEGPHGGAAQSEANV